MFQIDRRNFITTASLALAGTQLNWAAESKAKGSKNVLFIYLSGGLSHLDSTCANLNLPEKHRPVMGVVDTKAGFQLGGTFEQFSKHSMDMTIPLSFYSKDGNHSTACAYIMTGFPHFGIAESAQLKEPSYGPVISRMLGSKNELGIPTYTKVNKIEMGGARRDANAWLPKSYIGFDVDDDAINNLKFGIPKSRVDQRMAIVDMIDRKDSSMDRQWSELRNEAYNIAVGKASEAFDLSKEPLEIQNKFKLGKSGFGKSLLMARRLIENGSRFVSVSTGGFDWHNDIEKNFKAQGPELDWGLYTIIDDLKRTGLLESTLVIITTEFGRTTLNVLAGRDHWANVTPLIFVGGGYQHGRTIGSLTDNNMAVKDKPFLPADLSCTILDHFGIQRHEKVMDSLGRPHHLFQDDAKNILT